jgi:hypothetical protein
LVFHRGKLPTIAITGEGKANRIEIATLLQVGTISIMRLDILRAASNCPVPLSRTAALLIAIFIVIGLSLLQGYPAIPPPGLAIGLLGAGAVIVAVRTDHLTLWEKIGWVCVAFLLFAVEIKAIYHDRDEHDKEVTAAQERQERNFKAIAGGLESTIKTSQEQFHATMQSSQKIFSKTREAADAAKEGVDNLTGGDGYCYFVGYTPEFMRADFMKAGLPRHSAFAYLVKKGVNPLYGVRATIRNSCPSEPKGGGIGGSETLVVETLPDFPRGEMNHKSHFEGIVAFGGFEPEKMFMDMNGGRNENTCQLRGSGWRSTLVKNQTAPLPPPRRLAAFARPPRRNVLKSTKPA